MVFLLISFGGVIYTFNIIKTIRFYTIFSRTLSKPRVIYKHNKIHNGLVNF